jgi:hypothetical protein
MIDLADNGIGSAIDGGVGAPKLSLNIFFHGCTLFRCAKLSAKSAAPEGEHAVLPVRPASDRHGSPSADQVAELRGLLSADAAKSCS